MKSKKRLPPVVVEATPAEKPADDVENDDAEDFDVDAIEPGTLDEENTPENVNYFENFFQKEFISREEAATLQSNRLNVGRTSEVPTQYRGWKVRATPNVSVPRYEQIVPDKMQMSLKRMIKDENHDVIESLFPMISTYSDVYMTGREYSQHVTDGVNVSLAAHIVNHVIKSRKLVLSHNQKLVDRRNERRKQQMNDATEVQETEKPRKSKKMIVTDDEPQYRDQGCTRAKVLVLTPTKYSAQRLIQNILDLLPCRDGKRLEVAQKSRFAGEFAGDFNPVQQKPLDYYQVFGGNTDDNFKVGISVNVGKARLFCDWSNSDIIVASPLGLRFAIGEEDTRDFNTTFLSSIEMLVVQDADVMALQNWEHVLYCVKHVNEEPKAMEASITRIREWCLAGLSKVYRQTILISGHEFPECNSLFGKYTTGARGVAFVSRSQALACIENVTVPKLQYVFLRIPVEQHTMQADVKFEYFTTKLFPRLKHLADEGVLSGVLMFVPSYFDYVRIRNYFKENDVSACLCSEYSKTSSMTRHRAFFADGRRPIMLVTERFHFFHRFRIKGIKSIIMYGLPMWSEFFSEIVDTAEQGAGVTCLYTKYDQISLSGAVGDKRSAIMLNDTQDTYTITS